MNLNCAIILLMLWSLRIISQTATVVIFTNHPEPFYVIANGIQQNTNYETHVRMEGITQDMLRVKIEFQNKKYAPVIKTISCPLNMESVYVLELDKETKTEKELKEFGYYIRKDLQKEIKSIDTTAPSTGGEKFILRLLNQVPLSSSGNTIQQSSSLNQANISTNASSGVSARGNVSVSVQSTAASTTTVTTSTSGQDVYVMPGYSGAVGCNWPMSEQEFAAARQSVQSKTFEDSKLTVAKQICKGKCLLASQVRDLMLLFDYEETRLDFAKYAYAYTFDIDNYYMVNDAFQYESSIEELNSYIHGRR